MRMFVLLFGFWLSVSPAFGQSYDEFCSCSCEYQSSSKRFESWFNCNGKKHHPLSSHSNYFECQSFIMSSPSCRPQDSNAERNDLLNMKLLKTKGDDLAFVCKNSKKPMAIVVRKTHYCDNTDVKQCMWVGSILNDSCNESLLRQFSLFHIRRGRYEFYDHGKYIEYPEQNILANYWDNELKDAGKSEGPGLILIDTQKCKVVGNVFLYDISILGSRESQVRHLNRRINEALDNEYKVDALINFQKEEFMTCSQNNARPILRQMWEMMNRQEQE